MRKPLIALYSPVAQSGKSTVADQLVALGNGVRMSFADPLRDAVLEVASHFFDGGTSEASHFLRTNKEAPIPGLGSSMRWMMQTLGTEWGRDLIHPDLWIKIATERSRKYRASYFTVIDDMRFPNEYHMVRKEGGLCVRVNRPGAVQTTGHPSEGLLNSFEFDHIIDNAGTMDGLRTLVWQFYTDNFGFHGVPL